MPESIATIDRLRCLAAGDPARLGEVFAEHHDRLRLLVSARIDHRVQARIDPSDVIQETMMEAYQRIDSYLEKPSVSLYVWLRYLAKQRLAMMHRHHLRAQRRDARREIPLGTGQPGDGLSADLAANLAAQLTSPSLKFSRIELRSRIQHALQLLDAKSREILILRHFEQLSNSEVAEVLGISATAACNRYLRALERLEQRLGLVPIGAPS